ncbi:MAG: type II secretion system protein J [Geitlerinemataceae cyanobacterium]
MRRHPLVRPLGRSLRSLRPKTLLGLAAAIARQRNIKRDRGFTLTEVLVAALIGALIVSGLLGVMVELLTTDARETARNETQREMQLALDYISTDLREAVYVYDGDCIADVAATQGVNAAAVTDTCSDMFGNGYVPVPANSTPVLAFWKLDDLPDAVKQQCATNSSLIIGDSQAPCLSGRAYTLVVYYLTRNEDNDPTWSGKGRIQRYELPRYDNSGNPVAGYVNPQNTGFESWPIGDDGTAPSGSPSSTGIVTLVDFVDDRPMNQIDELEGDASIECPFQYAPTPADATLSNYGFDDVRNFYACVRVSDSLLDTASVTDESSAFNQKVILFVRGNAVGKPGIDTVNEGFMPAIATQVLNRGVANKIPRSQ